MPFAFVGLHWIYNTIQRGLVFAGVILKAALHMEQSI